MKGIKLDDFIESLYFTPQYQFYYKNDYYLLDIYFDEENYCIDLICLKTTNIMPPKQLHFENKNQYECIKTFLDSKIFGDMTLYEAEKDIDVIIG